MLDTFIITDTQMTQIATVLLATIVIALALVLAISAFADGARRSKGVTKRMDTFAANRSTVIQRKSDEFIQSMRRVRRKRIRWAEFNLNQTNHADKEVLLYNSDFEYGTLIVRESCWLTLMEDIVFSPNEQHDSNPTAKQRSNGEYMISDGFIFGFFAAIITVGYRNVLHLNSYEISVSPLFSIRQGFYTHISVSALPFINGEGPSTKFGKSLRAANQLYIMNGRLGRSSHHGIHGHLAKEVTIDHVDLLNYEVAAISVNGWTDSLIRNVKMRRTFDRVPVRGIFTQARFTIQFAKEAAKRSLSVRKAVARLEKLMRQVERDVVSSGNIDKQLHPEAWQLFASRSGIIDGGATYGIVVTDRGAAVHEFGSPFVDGEGTNGLLIEDCSIENQQSHAVEVVGAVDADKKLISGMVGDLIDFKRLLEVGSISDDAWFSLQFTMARAIYAHYGVEERKKFGLFNMPVELVRWATKTDGRDLEWLANMVRDGVITYQRDVDRQAHVPKGAFGGRFDASANVYLLKLAISNVRSTGDSGVKKLMPGETSILDPSEYTQSAGGHPNKGSAVGYNGADVHGILIAGCVNVTRDSVTVVGSYSKNGKTTEISVQ